MSSDAVAVDLHIEQARTLFQHPGGFTEQQVYLAGLFMLCWSQFETHIAIVIDLATTPDQGAAPKARAGTLQRLLEALDGTLDQAPESVSQLKMLLHHVATKVGICRHAFLRGWVPMSDESDWLLIASRDAPGALHPLKRFEVDERTLKLLIACAMTLDRACLVLALWLRADPTADANAVVLARDALLTASGYADEIAERSKL